MPLWISWKRYRSVNSSKNDVNNTLLLNICPLNITNSNSYNIMFESSWCLPFNVLNLFLSPLDSCSSHRILPLYFLEKHQLSSSCYHSFITLKSNKIIRVKIINESSLIINQQLLRLRSFIRTFALIKTKH